MAEIEKISLEKIPKEGWRELLKKSPYATIYHTIEWMRVWIETFPSWKGFFVLLRENDEILAGMPIIEVNRFGLKSYYSMPYGTYGGIIGRRKFEILSYLLKRRPFERIFIESFEEYPLLEKEGFKKIERGTHITPLPSESTELWKRMIHKKTKGQIEEARRKGVEIKILDKEEEIILCYEMVKETEERHRGLVKFPVELYKNIFKIMLKNLRWTIAMKENTYLAHLIAFPFKETIYIWGNASFSYSLPYRPNNALWWEMIEWGCRNGYKYANLGASPPEASGLIRWKERLGGEERVYHSYLWESKIWNIIEKIRGSS